MTSIYFRLCGLLLAAAAAAKIYSAAGTAPILLMIDPFFGVSYQTLMMVIGAAEIAIAGFLLFGRNELLRAFLLFGLSCKGLLWGRI